MNSKYHNVFFLRIVDPFKKIQVIKQKIVIGIFSLVGLSVQPKHSPVVEITEVIILLSEKVWPNKKKTNCNTGCCLPILGNTISSMFGTGVGSSISLVKSSSGSSSCCPRRRLHVNIHTFIIASPEQPHHAEFNLNTAYPFFPFFLASEDKGEGERLLFLKGVDFTSWHRWGEV